MGIVKLVLEEGKRWKQMGIKGEEIVKIEGMDDVRKRKRVED